MREEPTGTAAESGWLASAGDGRTPGRLNVPHRDAGRRQPALPMSSKCLVLGWVRCGDPRGRRQQDRQDRPRSGQNAVLPELALRGPGTRAIRVVVKRRIGMPRGCDVVTSTGACTETVD